MNASQLATYQNSMKIPIKTQKYTDKQTKWQTIEKFMRKRQKKKRIAEHLTIKDRSELDPGELG